MVGCVHRCLMLHLQQQPGFPTNATMVALVLRLAVIKSLQEKRVKSNEADSNWWIFSGFPLCKVIISIFSSVKALLIDNFSVLIDVCHFFLS